MKLKNIVSILLLIAMGVASLASPAAAAEVEEVYFFSSIGAYQKLLEQEVAAWNEGEGAAKGVRIVMETNIDNYATALDTMIMAGTYPDLADMYGRPEYKAAGYIRDLYTVPGIEEEIERFKPYFDQGTNLWGNKLYAMPLELVPLKMVYNAEIFEACGLTEPPRTWDEMADYAKIITEKGAGKFYGFGWTIMWAASWYRLLMATTISSVGRYYFDNANGIFDFTPWEPGVKAIARMYQEGSMFPSPMDQHIDPIRNRFAEGLVGMEMAPAYDVSVYNIQFPCNFEWKVVDAPALTDAGLQFKGACLNRGNVSITKWVSEERLPKVVEAWKFLHSRDLYKKLYSNSAIIPHEADIIEEVKAEGFEKELKNWAEMSDTTNYTFMPINPGALVTVEGDSFVTVFNNIMLGDTTWEKEIDSLNERYNKAYQEGKENGIIDASFYEIPYSSGPRE